MLDDQGRLPDDMNVAARETLQKQLRKLLADHSRWAKYNLVGYHSVVYLSISSSIAAAVAALLGADPEWVAGAAIGPIVLSALQSHIDFKRRLRWNNEYLRELRHLEVRLPTAEPESVSDDLRKLCAQLDSAEYDPDDPAKLRDLIKPRTDS